MPFCPYVSLLCIPFFVLMYLSIKHEGGELEFGEAIGEEGFDRREDEYAFFSCE